MSVFNDSDTMCEMTALILRRLASHSIDRVDWSLQDDEQCNFLSLAAHKCVLSSLYPLGKDQPYYVAAPEPLVLTDLPFAMEKWKGDWDRMVAKIEQCSDPCGNSSTRMVSPAFIIDCPWSCFLSYYLSHRCKLFVDT